MNKEIRVRKSFQRGGTEQKSMTRQIVNNVNKGTQRTRYQLLVGRGCPSWCKWFPQTLEGNASSLRWTLSIPMSSMGEIWKEGFVSNDADDDAEDDDDDVDAEDDDVP